MAATISKGGKSSSRSGIPKPKKPEKDWRASIASVLWDEIFGMVGIQSRLVAIERTCTHWYYDSKYKGNLSFT
jgi:hypothetical protein